VQQCSGVNSSRDLLKEIALLAVGERGEEQRHADNDSQGDSEPDRCENRCIQRIARTVNTDKTAIDQQPKRATLADELPKKVQRRFTETLPPYNDSLKLWSCS